MPRRPPEALAISAQSAAPRTRLRQSCRLVSASRQSNLLRLPGECLGGTGKSYLGWDTLRIGNHAIRGGGSLTGWKVNFSSAITGRFPIYCRGRRGRKRGLQLLVKYSLVLWLNHPSDQKESPRPWGLCRGLGKGGNAFQVFLSYACLAFVEVTVVTNNQCLMD